MPDISLSELPRYILAPIVFCVLLAVADANALKELPLSGLAGLLIAGVVLYYIYRATFYPLTMWFSDLLGQNNCRNYIKSKYHYENPSSYGSSIDADRVFVAAVDGHPLPSDRLKALSSAVHGLYQSSLVAFGFALYSVWKCSGVHTISFLLVALALSYCAYKLDSEVEYHLVLRLKSEGKDWLIKAANAAGLTQKS